MRNQAWFLSFVIFVLSLTAYVSAQQIGESGLQFDSILTTGPILFDDDDDEEEDHEGDEDHDDDDEGDEDHEDGDGDDEDHEDDHDDSDHKDKDEDDADKDGKSAGKKKKGAKSDSKKKDDEKKDDEPKDVEFSGRFASTKTNTVSVHLEEWSSMSIKKVVKHGQQVRKGDVIVELDFDGIDKSIADLEHSISLEKISLDQARFKLDMLKRTTRIDLDDARMANRIAQEDKELFFDRDKKRSIERNDFSLKRQKDFLAYQEEELKQLLQMYEADDLTEETEEIILKRTRDGVESARFNMKSAVESHEDFSKYDLPRRQRGIEQSADQAKMALEKAEATLPASVREAELGLKKQEVGHKRSLEKLSTLKRDRKAMRIVAPADGVLYYGEADNGVFPSARKLAAQMRPHGSLSSDKVFATVVRLRPMNIIADVSEENLRHVKPGTSVKVSPKAFPDMEVNGKIKSVSKFPVADGKFGVMVQCNLDKAPRVVPGMSCDIKFTPKSKKKKKTKQD